MVIQTPRGQVCFNPFDDVARGQDRVTKRNAVAKMAGEEESRRAGFELAHRIFISAVTDVVLRYGLRV